MGQKRAIVVPPIPQPFQFDREGRRPLLPLAAVATHLGGTNKEITSMVEEGKLRWAFDIRTATAKRREVRVLSQSLSDYLVCRRRIDAEGMDPDEFPRIVDLVLPAGIILSPETFMPPESEPGLATANGFHRKLRLPATFTHDMLFPREPVLRATEVAECFSCLGQHVLNLIKENTFKAINLRRGPKASPLITRASVVEFLRNRRIQ